MEKTKACTYRSEDDYAPAVVAIEAIADSFRYDSLVRRELIPDLCALTGTLRAKPGTASLADHRDYFFQQLQYAYTEMDASATAPNASVTHLVEKTCAALAGQWQPEFGERFQFARVLGKGALTVTVDVTTYVGKTPVVWYLCFEPWNAKTKEKIILRALMNWVFTRGARMVGIILVRVEKYLLFDLTGWAKRPLQQDVHQITRCLRNRACLTYRESLFMKYPAGNSVGFEGPLSVGLDFWIQSCYENYGQVRPVQVFLADPFADDPDYAEVHSLVAEAALPLFIHAPLNMNISGLSDGPSKILRSVLRLGKKMGARAVTVHAGRANQQGVEESLQRQAELLRSCLGESDAKTCLLCVETPCGKESDICTSFESMNSFFLDYFTEAERKCLGITIDTCHVFNAGNDPVKYMRQWLERGSVQIGLCHWNDAVNFFGVGVEGHHNPDRPGGAIGHQSMEAIAVMCVENGIPFLFE